MGTEVQQTITPPDAPCAPASGESRIIRTGEVDLLELFTRRQLNLVLMGMSGIGKSEAAKRLDVAFDVIDVDHEIGACTDVAGFVHPYQQQFPEEPLVLSMGRWFGKPWKDVNTYIRNQNIYLEIERKKTALATRRMREGWVFDEHGTKKLAGNILLDSTGSMVYCVDEIKRVRHAAHLAYLAPTPEWVDERLAAFRVDDRPKPIVWDEDLLRMGVTKANVADRFAELVRRRDYKYRAAADSVVPFDVHRNVAWPAVDAPADEQMAAAEEYVRMVEAYRVKKAA